MTASATAGDGGGVGVEYVRNRERETWVLVFWMAP